MRYIKENTRHFCRSTLHYHFCLEDNMESSIYSAFLIHCVPVGSWLPERSVWPWGTGGHHVGHSSLVTHSSTFSVSFSLMHCLIGPGACPVTQGLFRSVLLVSKCSGDFPILFLLLISSLTPLWLKNILYIQLQLFKMY